MKKSRGTKKVKKGLFHWYTKSVLPPYSFQDFWPIAVTIVLFVVLSIFLFGKLNAQSGNFQPSAPYYAAFYYPWFKNQLTDGSWSGSTWNDADMKGSHSPPANWFSNYLPDTIPTAFEPANELYSSHNYQTFKWQVAKMAEAKIEVAISSWWGPNHKTDIALKSMVTDYMKRSDNPYPNLRFGLYYECEGNTGTACNNTNNPSVDQITAHLNYVADTYANHPSMLKIQNKPVIFVYGDASDVLNSGSCTDPANRSVSARWAQANSRAKIPFYIVLKVYSGFATDTCQPDSWHQYAPAARSGSHGTHSYFVSPGFWRSGDPVRLCRNLNGSPQANCESARSTTAVVSFEQAVSSMVSSNTVWKLIQTWNEWGEGSSVEPGTEVVQANSNATATINPNGKIFGNAYIEVLNRLLPNLEAGVGNPGTATRVPTPTPLISSNGTDPIIIAAGDIACGADSTSSSCKEWSTSELIGQIRPDTVLALGDVQYERGQLNYFLGNDPYCTSGTTTRCYSGTWGRFKSITKPAVGNHEYGTTNASGYFDYFNGVGQQFGAAGDRTKGYYAFDVGAWRLYAINSNCSKVGGCAAGTVQERWLRQDLATHTGQCSLMYMHHPLWGSQPDHVNTQLQPIYKAFHDYGGDLILVGHIHFYERFAPMNASGAVDEQYGVRQIIVGTGGRNTYGPPAIAANSLVRSRGNEFGVLKVRLGTRDYSWQFVPIPGTAFTDSGSAICHGAPGTAPLPTTIATVAPTTTNPTATPTRRPTSTPTPIPTPLPTTVSGEQVTYSPTDDATLKSESPNSKYGSTTSLETDTDSLKNFILKFTLSGSSGRTVRRAVIRLTNFDKSPHGGTFYRTTSSDWSESSVTWANAPATSGGAIGTIGAVNGTSSSPQTYEVEVTSAVTGDGTYSFRVTSTNDDGADYYSKQDSSGRGPKLVITY